MSSEVEVKISRIVLRNWKSQMQPDSGAREQREVGRKVDRACEGVWILS